MWLQGRVHTHAVRASIGVNASLPTHKTRSEADGIIQGDAAIDLTDSRVPRRRALRHDADVRAYKFLGYDGTTLFTRFQWPLGEWVEAEGALAWCDNGIHACRIEHLPHWLGQELWLMELAGETVAAPDAVVARRGRLVERITAWSGGLAREFGDYCAGRARELAEATPAVEGRAGDRAADAAFGSVSAAAYIAAVVAGEVGSGSRSGSMYQECFLRERARQAMWLEDRLALSD